MTSIRITIREDDKAIDFIRFLSEIDFLEIHIEEQTSETPTESKSALNQLCGLWRDRNITLESLREHAWGRGIQ